MCQVAKLSHVIGKMNKYIMVVDLHVCFSDAERLSRTRILVEVPKELDTS